MQHLMDNSLAASTSRHYHQAFNKFNSFCQSNSLYQSSNTLEENLLLYCTHLSSTASYSNIKIHISAIKHHYNLKNMLPQDTTFPRLYTLLRGIKRTCSSKKNPKRIPITITTLKTLYQRLQQSRNFSETDKRMLWAAFTTAFFGFLRASEFTSPSAKTYHEHNTLLVQDIKIANDIAHINIKQSKTDPFRSGCIIKLAAVGSSVCAVSALHHHLHSHPTGTGPLFTFNNKTFLTRRKLNEILKTLLQPTPDKPISSHSFRIGAATTANAAGISTVTIQQLGRWASDAYKAYTRITDTIICQTAHTLANHKT